MSLGNLNTADAKKNNAVYQRQEINVLYAILNALIGGIVVSATVAPPLESTVTTDPVRSAEGQGLQTSAGLDAAVAAWILAHPTRKVVRQVAVIAGDGIPVIYISHTA